LKIDDINSVSENEEMNLSCSSLSLSDSQIATELFSKSALNKSQENYPSNFPSDFIRFSISSLFKPFSFFGLYYFYK
jgi:hypothetical protein